MLPKTTQFTKNSKDTAERMRRINLRTRPLIGYPSTPFGMKFPRNRGKHCLTLERNEDAESIYNEKPKPVAWNIALVVSAGYVTWGVITIHPTRRNARICETCKLPNSFKIRTTVSYITPFPIYVQPRSIARPSCPLTCLKCHIYHNDDGIIQGVMRLNAWLEKW
jgi:hypothetical protein